MTEFISIVTLAGLIAFPIIHNRQSGVIQFDFIIGIAFGLNYNKIDLEDLEDENKYYTQHMFQFHLGFLTTTMSFLVQKSFEE
tara:strand:+ start:498 stop:746 length:249 start_codon:yes stop_codon:yes gene_type:complete